MTALLQTLWPLFALILGGLALRRWNFPGEAFWPAAERLNYFILFPALLFSSLARAPLNNPALPRLALAVLLGLGIAWLALLAVRRLRGWPAGRFGAFTQGILRFNTYLGLAVVGRPRLEAADRPTPRPRGHRLQPAPPFARHPGLALDLPGRLHRAGHGHGGGGAGELFAQLRRRAATVESIRR